MKKKMAAAQNLYTDKPSPIAVGRMKFDISQIENDKAIIEQEGIYYNFNNDENISTHYHQLIIGPDDTPYQAGFYLFKAQFPNNYPFKPMTMKTLTQGEKVRKHPNLYVCGKCCFSFLGTWQGPPWTPCNNPRSVGVSMRSVMTPFPLENEPGYEDVNKRQSLHKTYANIISWFNIKHAVCGVMENIDNPDMSYRLFKNDIIKLFNKNFERYMLGAKNVLKYEEELIKTNGNSIVKSPVYGFSINYDVKNIISKLENLYSVFSGQINIDTTLSDSKMICEGDDKPKDNEIVVNTQDDDNKETKPKKVKKTPTEKASKFSIGFKLVSENDGQTYEVYETKGKTPQKRWKKCK
tara:strand:+ start:1463 stop:2515 length:1053 start_codon:yes stop_codon:yes gene_type:complete